MSAERGEDWLKRRRGTVCVFGEGGVAQLHGVYEGLTLSENNSKHHSYLLCVRECLFISP